MREPISLPIDPTELGQESVRICRDLVRINTVNPYSGDKTPGSEAAGQDYLEPLLREAGAVTLRFEPPPDIYARLGMLGPQDRRFDGRPNLVAEWRFGSGNGPRILIQGHMDTVGVDSMAIDPFSALVEDGRIFGRGASDMKGAMGAAVAALRAVARQGPELDGSIVFQSVVDEECDGVGAGAMACIDRGIRGDVAISIDGSGPELVRGYGGVLTARIVVRGSAGHAAAPIDLGKKSAMERALTLGHAVMDFRKERWLQTGFPTNLGVFQSGNHPATVPGEAVLGINISYGFREAKAAEADGNGYGGAALRSRFEAIVRETEPDAEITWVKDAIPFETDADHLALKEMASVYRAVFGDEPQIKTMLPWTDACHLWHHGKMPTFVCGAGTPGQSHSDREHVDIWRVEACARLLATYLYTKLRRN